MIQLFKKHSTGAIGWWSVHKRHPFIVYEYCVVEGGAVVSNQELVEVNASGRSWDQQAGLMMQSRANRKMQRGYKATYMLAMDAEYSSAEDGSMLPMKAIRIEKAAKPKSSKMWVQPKLNGHRCTITRNADGSMTARSGAGNLIHTIDHVLEVMKPFMPEDLPIDGEIYVHGWPLQYIGSRIKKQYDNSSELQFVSYDVCDTSVGFGDRLQMLIDVIKPAWTIDKRVNLVATREVTEVGTKHDYLPESAWDYFWKFREQGYEGAMLRYDGMGYQPGARSTWLQKMKKQIDMEFKVLGMFMSQRGVPMLKLQTAKGVVFDCTAPGSYPEKYAMYDALESVVGKMMTCEFAEWTTEGTPSHCVALQLREDV